MRRPGALNEPRAPVWASGMPVSSGVVQSDADWATAKMNLAKRGAEFLVQRDKGSQDTAAQSQSGKEPKREGGR